MWYGKREGRRGSVRERRVEVGGSRRGRWRRIKERETERKRMRKGEREADRQPDESEADRRLETRARTRSWSGKGRPELNARR